MRLALALIGLIGLFAALLGAAGPAHADAPPGSDAPSAERWSADPRLWLALIEWRQRLRLELESSRELCTAGTLTEVSWQIAGGTPPYKLQVEGTPVNADADNVRINCGALSEAEAADEDAALAAKRVTAVVTDARGVRREATIDVARARALPAAFDLGYGSHLQTVTISWSEVDPSLSSAGVVRYRSADSSGPWSYSVVVDRQRYRRAHTFETPTGEHLASVAAVRHVLEAETPEALNWSEELRFARTVAPQNLIATATHDTVTVAWDKQPYTNQMPSVRLRTTSNRDGSLSERVFEEDGEYGRHEVVFKHVLPDTEYVVTIIMSDLGTLVPTSTTVRTMVAPAGWVPPPRGPQNLRATATRDNITVTWEHPHDAVRAPYIVELLDAHSGALLNHTWVSTQTSWTGRALNGAALRPGKQYRIRVKLMTFTLPTVEVVVRVPAAQTSASGAQDEEAEQELPRLPFFPIWPVAVDDDYVMTDDPFEWRGLRYHAGLDIGERIDGGGDVSGDPVYAVEAGTLRLFGNEQGGTVLYCRDERRLLHNRFHASKGGWGSAWWDRDKEEMYQGGSKQADEDVFCDDVMSSASGRGALIAHTLPDGRGVVTKYAHLASATREILEALGVHSNCFDSDGEIKSPDDDKCKVNSSLSVHVSRGQRIGTIGASFYGDELNEFFDEHVHFEIRTFDVPLDDGEEWYTKADRCGNQVTSDADCTWNGRTRRYMKSVEDAEAYLPPLPASTTPTDRGWRWYRSQPIAEANLDRHVVEVASARESDGTLAVETSIAIWRPLFYTRFEGQELRTQLYGIAGTGPGVTGYGTDITASPTKSDEACGGGPFQPVPAGSSTTTEGELPRQTREVRLSRTNGPCVMHILTANSRYPAPEVLFLYTGDDRYRENISLRDPSVTLTWVAELSAGTNRVRTGESLRGDALDLYTFTAYAGHSYEFCAYLSSQSPGDCADTVAQLLLFGPSGEVEQLNVVGKPNQLSWTEPADGPRRTTYTLVVRRRARVEGTVTPYSYNLKYTIPRIRRCTLGEAISGTPRSVCDPTYPIFVMSTLAHNTVTVSVTNLGGATSGEAKRTRGANCDAEGTLTTFKLPSANTAGGVSGAADTPVPYEFSGLAASTPYTLCVRSVRTIETGFVLKSDWTSVSVTTPAKPDPPAPPPPTCAADESTKPSTTQTVTSTETRWVSAGVYEYLEQRTKSQAQVRSVTWNSSTCAWSEGAWRNSGSPSYSVWSATGAERCKEPYATKLPETKTETVTGQQWVLRETTAYQQSRTGTEHYSRSVAKTGPRACGWTNPAWGSPDRTVWGGWTDTGTSKTRPVDQTRTVSTLVNMEWRVVGATACQWRQHSDQPQTKRAKWVAPNWVFGGAADWRDSGSPSRRWSKSSTCKTRQADQTRTVSTLVKTEWRVGSSQACQWTQYSDQRQTKRAKWVAPNWVFGGNADWRDSGSPTLRWSRGSCWAKPAHDVVTVRLWGPWDRPRWVREESPIICFVHEEKRRSYKYAYYFRPHVWSGTAEAWVDGRRNATPYFTEPDYSRWTDWARTGTFRLCPQRSSGAAGQSETAERKPAQLAAGDYKLQWGDSVIGFTVPAGATVEVRSRRLDSGKDAAVFSVAGGAELLVTPDMLAEDAATGLADTSDPTLAALSSSLALVQADAAQASAATETACTEAAKPESGATPVDLADEACVIVRGGGAIRVALGVNTLTLTLPAARDWLVFAAPQSSADAESAFWFLDLTTGGRIVLSPSDGSELERHIPADATGLPALLDAIAASAAPSVYPAADR